MKLTLYQMPSRSQQLDWKKKTSQSPTVKACTISQQEPQLPNCSEFKTQLQARAIKDVLKENISLHWVHSGAQVADALAKRMEAHFLRERLKNWILLSP